MKPIDIFVDWLHLMLLSGVCNPYLVDKKNPLGTSLAMFCCQEFTTLLGQAKRLISLDNEVVLL